MAAQLQSGLPLATTHASLLEDELRDESVPQMEQAHFVPDLAMLEEAIENSLDCVAVVDLQGTVLYMNLPGACQLELDDQPSAEQISWPELWARDCSDLAEYSIESARSGRACRFTAHRLSRHGARKWWDIGVTPVRDRHGNPVQMFCVARNITDLKNSAFETKRALVTESNHRIHNSLATVASLLSLQAHRTQDETVRTSLQQARSRVIAAAEMHRHLYEIDGDERVDVGDCIAAVARKSVAALSGENNVQLRLACPHGIALHADRAMTLALLTTELITNCMKHAFQGRDGILEVALHARGARLALHVDDNGPGLPETFDALRNAGIGMQVVLSLVNQLHGQLKIERLGPGAHFRVLLPWDATAIAQQV